MSNVKKRDRITGVSNVVHTGKLGGVDAQSVAPSFRRGAGVCAAIVDEGYVAYAVTGGVSERGRVGGLDGLDHPFVFPRPPTCLPHAVWQTGGWSRKPARTIFPDLVGSGEFEESGPRRPFTSNSRLS